jgi:rubredoxin
LFPRIENDERSALNTPGTVALSYFCPICGIDLELSDFQKTPEDYYCPFCGSQQTPSRAAKRDGWQIPD